eukprot:10397150-Heterocapsa_arctica.AAC.1
MEPQLHLRSDSSAGVAVASRRGFGRLRHLEIKQLWLQDEVRERRLYVHHCSGLHNVSDLLTKCITGVRYAELKEIIGLRIDDEKDEKNENIKGLKDDEKIKGLKNDVTSMVAMLSQHAPPTCNCGEL